MSYCASRYQTIRRRTIEVKAGSIGMGADNPIRIQSMTTSDTQDIAATVRQSIALAEAGCEIIRVTAPNVPAAKCLRDIRAQFSAAGFANVPLVADIHFLPSAAMEAIEHVEKVRINPGNYADKKKFAIKDCTDADYDRELQRIHEAFTPLVLRAKTLGRSLRIGANHGSLSDRIMNRYGDTPLGMVESALEFLRIARAHSFDQIVLSMKASNPKVMIQAYRLLVARMQQEDMHYPLHLGVTEAGDGEDGRIKSAIGIGSLLQDGLGDTIRVSLTEDSVNEIPVARALAAKAQALWQKPDYDCHCPATAADSIDPCQYTRRDIAPLTLAPAAEVSTTQPPRVITRAPSVSALPETLATLSSPALADTPAEGMLVPVADKTELAALIDIARDNPRRLFVAEIPPALTTLDLSDALAARPTHISRPMSLAIMRAFDPHDDDNDNGDASLLTFAILTQIYKYTLVAAIPPHKMQRYETTLNLIPPKTPIIFTLPDTAPPAPPAHPTSEYRRLAETLRALAPSPLARAPIWIRNTHFECGTRNAECGMPDRQSSPPSATPPSAIPPSLIPPSATPPSLIPPSVIPHSTFRIPHSALHIPHSALHIPHSALRIPHSELRIPHSSLDASILTGSLLCDGIGDILSVETEPDPVRATKLAYDILQGAGARISKTEFVACPSCGRTLFDLQTTTRRIREKTGHLKGVKLAIMGCIVNGPGEMADADFGYVGGAPGKINLYVGKNCVQFNIPQADADDRLIDLIKQHGKWIDPS